MLHLVKKTLPQYKTIRFNKGKLQCYLQGIPHRADNSEKEPIFFNCLKPESSNIFGQLCLITRDKTLIFIVT